MGSVDSIEQSHTNSECFGKVIYQRHIAQLLILIDSAGIEKQKENYHSGSPPRIYHAIEH